MDRVSCAQNGKDVTSICIPQYKEAFFRLMSSGGLLYFRECKWTDAEVKQLAAALQCAHAEGATSQADVLNLIGNQLTDTALPTLVEMLKAGAMPCLNRLWLMDNISRDATGVSWVVGMRDSAAKKALEAAAKERGVKVRYVL